MPVPPLKRVEELFNEAVALPPEHRPAFLAAACGDDAELLAAVEPLLRHDADSTDILRAGPLAREADVARQLAPTLPAQEKTSREPLPQIPGYEVAAGFGARRHGRRLPGAASAAQAPRRPEDAADRPRPHPSNWPVSAPRPRHWPGCITRISCRFTTWASGRGTPTSRWSTWPVPASPTCWTAGPRTWPPRRASWRPWHGPSTRFTSAASFTAISSRRMCYLAARNPQSLIYRFAKR